MKKILRHKWIKVGGMLVNAKCEKCGCTRVWDSAFGCVVYQWGNRLTYRAPDCIIITDVPYNK